MSTRDLERLEVLNRIKEKSLKQSIAAQILDIRPRQVRRLLRRLDAEGSKGLVSKRVGAPSNNRVSKELKKGII